MGEGVVWARGASKLAPPHPSAVDACLKALQDVLGGVPGGRSHQAASSATPVHNTSSVRIGPGSEHTNQMIELGHFGHGNHSGLVISLYRCVSQLQFHRQFGWQ